MELILTISTICLWVIMLFHLFLTFALIRRLNEKGNSNSKPIIDLPKDSIAPDFIAEKLNGESVTLASFGKHKIALIFIATYCSPCKELLPKIEALKEKALRGGIEIVLVSIEGKDVTRRYIEENAITLPVLITPNGTHTFMEDYKVSGTPAFCLITAQGRIYNAGVPHFDGEKWTVFEDFLAEKADFIEAEGGKAEKISLR